MRIRLSAVVSAIGFSFVTVAPLLAADIPAARRMAPVPVLAGYNWTGFYAGLHAGYGWADRDTTIGVIDATGFAQAAAAVGAFPLAYSFDRDGYVAGGQIGYNQQMDRWLWGVEADISATGLKGSQTVSLPQCAVCGFPNVSSVSQNMDWFGTVRGRAGIVANNWLFYGTGGLAFGNVKYSYMQSNTAFGGTLNTVGSDSNVEFGWTVGFGVEYGWGQWSFKAEYLYYDLGNHSFTVPHNLVPTIVQFVPRFENSGSLVRGGINYRFN